MLFLRSKSIRCSESVLKVFGWENGNKNCGAELRWQPNEAHNGYLETYLTLGLVGLFLLIGLLFATFFKIRRNLLRNLEWGRFQFGFLIATVAYNWTESGFKTLHPVWFVFFLIAIDYPRPQLPFTGQSFEVASGENSWVVVAQDES